MKRTVIKLTALALAAAVSFSAMLSATALSVKTLDENETPILKIEKDHSDKIPSDLKAEMDKADDDDLIGNDGSLVMHIDLPPDSDVPAIENWLEECYIEPLFESADISMNRLRLVGDNSYCRHSANEEFSLWESYDIPVPKMPDGSSFLRAFVYHGDPYRDGDDYEEFLKRGVVTLVLTKSEILRLCEEDDVICFEYGEEADQYIYDNQYVQYTSDDALNILRSSLESNEVPSMFFDLDRDRYCTSSDALIALRSSVFDFTVYFRLPRNRAAL